MKCLIAGGTGVIGKYLVPKLVELGHTVGVITRSDQKSNWVKAQGATPHQIDIFDQQKVSSVAKDYEVLVHTATSIPEQKRMRYSGWKTNTRLRLEGTDILLKAAIDNKYKLYIQESFVSIYGERGNNIIDETAKIDYPVITKVKLNDDVNRINDSLVEMEEKVMRANKKFQLPTIILRFGIFYGYNQSIVIPSLVANQIPLVEEGKACASMVSVNDAAESIIASITNYEGNTGEIYNISDDEPVSFKDMIDFVNGITGKKSRSVPKFLVRLLFGKWLVNFLTQSCKMTNEKAKKRLKWRPAYPTYREGFSAEAKKLLESK